MFDTMTMTKVVGGVCGAFLVFLLGGWAAESIYNNGAAPHAEGEHAQGYVIAAAGGEETAAVEEGPSFEELYASADAAAGEKVFKKCQACHSVEAGKNGTGPSLHGVVDRPVQAIADFNYSGALIAVSDVWSPEHLNSFLTSPKNFAPGTAMNFNGLPKAQDRADLIAYLATQAN